ncbi:putative polysaccharide deacetylase [Gottschalkia acidurici 9a]|uniref:Polysaccharide deacetylase n=1 Tax=Gottschalkia acidurici (strain ATCC 7906 / DSM 604 / BCRC 14475 / CIP 104303 / KCTC 5404 / NCIMB 10678 / 9a) TaxID=1128398 RepID=K0AZ99_GOTA9|nr:polysaccharide deacetylase family protein [Gottschalkia acidurici]AFS77701.1 putative polysaccharide deacetylase [Gottschalkia acidurici 9a]
MMLKNNKKLTYTLLAFLLVVLVIIVKGSMTTEGKRGSQKVSIYLNNELIKFKDDEPVNKEGTIYAPLNEFAEKIDAKVKYDLLDNKVLITKKDKHILIKTKENLAITEENKSFFIETIGKSKSTLVPVALVSKHFDYKVSEESKKSTVRINEKSTKVNDDQEKKESSDKGKAVNTIANNKQTPNTENNKENKQSQKNEPKDNNSNVAENKETQENKDPNNDEKKDGKVAYLTFDDGPNINTPQILDVLKEKNVKATFFMLGSSIGAHGDIAKRVSEEGHALGLHSVTHNYKSVYASPDSFLQEMNTANNMLHEATGKNTLLIRAPYGSKPYMKQEFRDLAISWGYRIWDWNVDSRDSIKKNTTPDEVYNNVANQLTNKNEVIILFHDREHTLKALPRVIDYLHSQGFEIKKLDTSMTPMNFWGDTR